MSKPARITALAVVVAAVAFEVVAWVVYRNSSDGQTPVLWVFIALYAGLLIGGIKVLDSTARRLVRWMRRT
jgi:hypothetical protein